MRKCLGLLPAVLLVAACGGEPAGEATGQGGSRVGLPVVEDTLVAEAAIEPARWSALGFKAAGVVSEVLVDEGDRVAAGDLLVRLDPTHAQLAVRQSEVALQAAEAQLALLEAGARAQQVAVAEAQLEAAEARQAQAAAQHDQLRAGAKRAEIAAAEARVAAARAEQRRAEESHDKTMECFTVKNPYTGEEREVCPALGLPEEQTRYALETATESLAAANARLRELQARPNRNELRAAAAGVQAAAAERQVTQAQLDLARAGPIEEEIAVAQAQVARARAALEVAQAAVAHTEVRAPFAGTVAMISVKVGNVVVPGQVACTVATVGQRQARTKDLSELDVAGIEPGQSVRVTVDSLPEREFEGVVQKVALQADDHRGEAVFAVTVKLVDVGDAPLRWGMTAWVDFGTP